MAEYASIECSRRRFMICFVLESIPAMLSDHPGMNGHQQVCLGVS